ncbi:MAG TPA: helix-turn-helix transcriptional regulator [Myxococcota bacterium]|nr:helix-turn-helix transcriptional regulator [Myxococcota bacterium]
MSADTAKNIRKLLIDAGVTQVDLAERIGVTKQMVGMTIHGATKSPRVRQGIARELGKTYSEVWGEEDPDGVTPSLDQSSATTHASAA